MRAAALAVVLALAACAPRLSPPYRDYEVRPAPTAVAAEAPAELTERLRASAEASGWRTVAAADARAVSTAPREVASGLLTRTDAALDLVPLDGGFVRVYVRAERRNVVFGGRSKVYALTDDLRRRVLGPVSEALRERGLVPLGTPRDRDEDATDEAP